MPQFIPAIIGLVSGIAGSAIQNKESNRTSTYEREGTSTTSGHLNRRQRRLDKAVIKQLMDLIQGGPGNIPQSEKNAAYGDINTMYNAQIPRLRAMATAHGNVGGQLGSLELKNEVDRSNARQRATAGLLDKSRDTWLKAIFGSKAFTTPLSSTTTTSESGSGTSPSQFGNALAGAGQNFATALWLKNLLGESGGGSEPFQGEDYAV